MADLKEKKKKIPEVNSFVTFSAPVSTLREKLCRFFFFVLLHDLHDSLSGHDLHDSLSGQLKFFPEDSFFG